MRQQSIEGIPLLKRQSPDSSMADRNYTLIDFSIRDDLRSDLDRLVRFMEYVRSNFDRIVTEVPSGCEVDLFAGGHAHNPKLMPLLGVWTPVELLDQLPHPERMIDEISEWSSRLSPDEVDNIIAATPAPTWDELVRSCLHPVRRHNE